ncbi:hypothetical protein O3Q52_26250 [Streptomyces sp. ActVer]|uniref:hypothetical protein n=1 Tax=Streptomyces sp. ActVer TaxID=3014558 RepID=UPI0022B3495E|nr:hypothetical protein [Streptomyces sp. ActVer]MCZ4511625.1 hypothetical protein [Streptomyces sp. ActVer]
MPDRSLRLPPLLLRERRPSPTPPRESDDVPEGGQGSAGGQGSSGGRGGSGGAGGSGAPDSGQRPEPPQPPADDNPFAPPPEGTPDRPWQPRRTAGGQREGQDGQGDGSSPWGSQWSDRQPGPAQGGRFGDRPGTNGGSGGGQNGPEGPGGPGTGMRWDPTDPAQRRARFALLSGMWAFFFALFSWPYVALLLGALAMYWAISALRSKPPRTPDPNTPAPPTSGARPQTTAAISGLVTASLALAMVAATFTAQLVYSDYYTCVNDSLTNTAKKSCDKLLPEELRGLLGTQG